MILHKYSARLNIVLTQTEYLCALLLYIQNDLVQVGLESNDDSKLISVIVLLANPNEPN